MLPTIVVWPHIGSQHWKHGFHNSGCDSGMTFWQWYLTFLTMTLLHLGMWLCSFVYYNINMADQFFLKKCLFIVLIVDIGTGKLKFIYFSLNPNSCTKDHLPNQIGQKYNIKNWAKPITYTFVLTNLFVGSVLHKPSLDDDDDNYDSEELSHERDPIYQDLDTLNHNKTPHKIKRYKCHSCEGPTCINPTICHDAIQCWKSKTRENTGMYAFCWF